MGHATVTPMRAYQRSHPWITFAADLRKAPHTLWLLLGEAQSKCQHVAGVPLQPLIAKRLYEMYFVKGVHATAAIEGNSFSEEEVEKRIEGNLEVPPSKEYQAKEIDNLVRAFNNLISRAKRDGASDELTPDLLKSFNREILHDLTLGDDVVPGQFRTHSVGVADYRGAPAQDCEFLVKRLCDWLNDESFDGGTLGIGGAILKAILAHLYIAWIHPFGDGNGRTARLVEFYLLVNAGVPVPSAHVLSDHYNTTRPQYYHNLSYASKSGGDILPFLLYAISGFVDELREQVNYIREQQWGVAWRDYVNEYFENLRPSETQSRRKCLILDLSHHGGVVPRSGLTLLSPRVATYYARKTDKTLSRDLNSLIKAKLIARSNKGYRARRELILAFLPPKYEKKGQS